MAEQLVLTPGGFRSQSLVHFIEPGHGLIVDQGVLKKIEMASRTIIDLPPPLQGAIAPPMDRAKARPAAEPAVVPAFGTGWITYAWWESGAATPITSFSTNWVVPQNPPTNDGQTIFLFNGIQNTGANFGILQPVLQYGPSAAGGGAFWSIASWYVTSGGQAFHTTLVPVNVGQALVGVMNQTAHSGNQFSYNSLFQGIANTTLPILNIAPLHWANETLEAYDIARCSDYPASLTTSMTNINLAVGAGHPNLAWTAVNAVTDCHQHTDVVSNANPGGRVDLSYRGDQPIDAALYSGSKCYFFHGNKYIRVTRGDTGPGTVDEGYPANISNWNWGNFGASGIDTALYSGPKCYFFKGNQYIRVTRGDTGPGTVDAGYPAPISNWGWGNFGANGIDAALYSGSKCYFFKGNQYIRVTRGDTGPGTVDAGYPAPISNWNWGSFGASGIDAALYSGSKCYFFKGNLYVRVTRGDTGPGTVDANYPAHMSNWYWPRF
jgi:Hemopexin